MLVISYGNDIIKTTYDALAASDISSYLKSDAAVSLKPNLVVSGPASNGAVTHPEVAEGVILYLLDYGIRCIKIIESSSIGVSTADAYIHSGFDALSRKYNVPLVDLKNDKTVTLSHSNYNIKIYSEALSTDFLINLPVLKAHSQTRLTCCMKNLKGCIPDSEKRRFHTLGIHKPVAALCALVKTGYCVVDGVCGDLTFEEGGNPITANRIIAGRNPLMIDSYCAKLIGYKPSDIEYLSYGYKIGVGKYFSPEDRVIELGTENKPLRCADKSRNSLTADRYRNLIDERSACSTCYASLIHALHRVGGKVSVDRCIGVGGHTFTNTKLHIGQGFRGITAAGIGIGECAKGFSINVKGCPPTGTDIIEILR